MFYSGNRIEAAKVSCYALEKNRVHIQSAVENNFHIFDLILNQMTDEWKMKLHLENFPMSCDSKNCERPSSIVSFTSLDMALDNFGCSLQSKTLIFQWIAAILHLKLIDFDEDESCEYVHGVTQSTEVFMNNCASLLNISTKELENALLLRYFRSTTEK